MYSGVSNPLIRRVHRHRNMALLFRDGGSEPAKTAPGVAGTAGQSSTMKWVMGRSVGQAASSDMPGGEVSHSDGGVKGGSIHGTHQATALDVTRSQTIEWISSQMIPQPTSAATSQPAMRTPVSPSIEPVQQRSGIRLALKRIVQPFRRTAESSSRERIRTDRSSRLNSFAGRARNGCCPATNSRRRA